MIPFAHNSASPETFIDNDPDFDAIMSEDTKDLLNSSTNFEKPREPYRKAASINYSCKSSKQIKYEKKPNPPAKQRNPLTQPKSIPKPSKKTNTTKKPQKKVAKEDCSK